MMQTLNYTDGYLRRRKFYLFLPLLALPFLTFIYWVLIVKNLKSGQIATGSSGLQLSLPDALLKDERAMDKWQYYRKADQDSALRMKQIKRDPYRNGEFLMDPNDTLRSQLRGFDAPGKQKKARLSTFGPSRESLSHDVQVQQKLRNLERALSSSTVPKFEDTRRNPEPAIHETQQNDIANLEALLKSSESSNHVEEIDPELAQLNGMLDKILAIQNPTQNAPMPVSEQADPPAPALSVTASSQRDPISLLSEAPSDDSTKPTLAVSNLGFFGLEDDEQKLGIEGITAVIEKTQQLVSGATVQLRLTRPIHVNGQTIVENSFIYGVASLAGERLKIKISTISASEKILPVNLSVFDLDGIEGVYIPGTISRSVTKQAIGSQIQGADFDVGGFSLGAQAANAGMQMGRTLLGRKARLTEVTLQAGYKVILRDSTNTKTQITPDHENQSKTLPGN